MKFPEIPVGQRFFCLEPDQHNYIKASETTARQLLFEQGSDNPVYHSVKDCIVPISADTEVIPMQPLDRSLFYYDNEYKTK